MTSVNNYGKINGSKSVRCSCCPYGCHVDVEFIQYCESLLSSLYGKQLSSASNNNTNSSRGSFSLNRPPKHRLLTSTTSLPSDEATYHWLIDQNQGKGNHTSGHHIKTINNNNINNNNNNNHSYHNYPLNYSPSPNGHHHQSLNLNHLNLSSSNFLYRLRPVGRSNSSSRVHDLLNPPSPADKSLTDAVELFEKVLKEHEQAALSYSVPSSPAPYNCSPLLTSTPTRRGSFPRYFPGNGDYSNPVNSLPSSPNPLTGPSFRSFESQPPSPAGYSNNNTNQSFNSNSNTNHQNHQNSGNNKTLFNQFRDQLQVSVQKMRDLEQQVKDIPVLKQKILFLQAERKKLLENLNNGEKKSPNNPVHLTTEGSSNVVTDEVIDLNLQVNSSRLAELEKSGIITPPLTRRKFLFNGELPEESNQCKINCKLLCSLPNHILPSIVPLEETLSYRDCASQTDQPNSMNKQQLGYSVNNHEVTSESSLNASCAMKSSISSTSKSFKPNLNVNNKATPNSLRPSTLSLASTSTSNPLSSSSSQQQQSSAMIDSKNGLSPNSLSPQSSPTQSLATKIVTDTPSPKVYRSIGISVNIAPSLPRRSLVNLHRESDPKKVNYAEVDQYLQDQQHQVTPFTPKANLSSSSTTTLPYFTSLPRPLLSSRGTDPMPLDRCEAITQASPRTLHASVGTENFDLREVGISCDYRKDLNIRGNNRSSQTDRPRETLTKEKIIQVNGKCSNCEMKQMETIGVGDGQVYGALSPQQLVTSIKASEVGVNTDTPDNTVGNTRMVDSMISSISSMTSSIQSVKLCDKCNETITSLAREVVIKDKQVPSPGLGSRIPRLANQLPSTISTSASTQQQQLISMPLTSSTTFSSPLTATSIVTDTVSSTSSSSSQQQQQQQQQSISTESSTVLPIKSINLSNKIIIEEGNDDEILVFRDPNANLGSRKHRSNFPSMMTPQVDLEGIRLLDEAYKITDSEESDEGEGDEPESFSSSEGTYILEDGVIVPGNRSRMVNSNNANNINTTTTSNKNNTNNNKCEIIEPSKELRAALKVLNDSLLKPDRSNKPATAKSVQIIEKEWFSIAACKDSDPCSIEIYLDCFESFSTHLLNKIVNLTDSSGNTAMHYAISHSNFDVVSVLLDSKVCDVNKQNKAGYTAIMLVSTARVSNETQKEVIRRLFSLGDVNIRAKQNGQTALMLASSHGQFSTCKLLLEAGAALNVQDNDGSTALMCATEHGHIEIVKLLLSHPDCDPTIADNDKATAMSIAMECGRKDIAVLLYASSNMFSRGSSPYASLRRSQSKAITTQLQRTGSFTSSRSNNQSNHRNFSLAPSPPARSRHSSATTTTTTTVSVASATAKSTNSSKNQRKIKK